MDPSRAMVEFWAGNPADYTGPAEYDRLIEAVLACGTNNQAVWNKLRDEISES